MVALKGPPWDVGDEVVLFVEYVDGAEQPATPDEATLQIGRRDGSVLETFEIADLSSPTTGRLEKRYVIPEHDLVFSWDAVGAVTIAVEGTIPTRRRRLPRPLPA